ncbi:MAG: hypothetical protein AAF828_04785 [Bacteroidota bacterium]
MKHFTIAFLISLLPFLLTAQEANSSAELPADRKGQFWLGGNSNLAANSDAFAASVNGGYFFTDRLLIGSGLGYNDVIDFVVSPFARYYFQGSDKSWRPYAQAGLTYGFSSDVGLSLAAFRLGVERTLRSSSLLNIEAGVDLLLNDLDSEQYFLNAALNTMLGGSSGINAATGKFQKGHLIVRSQLANFGVVNLGILNTTSIGISPSGGLFLGERLLLTGGLLVGYTSSSFDFPGSPSSNQNTLVLDLRAGTRYYLATERIFNWFLEADLGYNRVSNNDEFFDFTVDLLRLSAGAGTSFFISDAAALDLGAYFVQGLNEGAGNTGLVQASLIFWLTNSRK